MVESKCTCELFGVGSCFLHKNIPEFGYGGLRPNIAPAKVNEWCVTLTEHGSDLRSSKTYEVLPGTRIEFSAFSMVIFRPTQLALSTNGRAKLNVELRLSNQFWDLGAIDIWKRRASQLPTAFVRKLVGHSSLTPANKIILTVSNYGKFPSRVFAQIDGVMVQNL